MKSIEQSHSERTGRAQARSPRRDIGHRGDLNSAFDAQQRQRLADKRMFDLRRVRHFFRARITNSNRIIEFAAHRHVDRLVDGGGEHSASMSPVVGRQVGASAQED